MKTIFPFALLCLLLPLLNSCASLSGFHTGRTVEEGNGEILLSLNLASAPDFSDDEDDILQDVFFANIEFGGRFGITEKLDAGIRVNSVLNVLMDVKYQVAGDKQSPFAMSLGGGVGTFSLISAEGSLFNFQVPVYTSYHPSENIGIYFSPRYIGQFGTDFSETIDYLSYLGANTGLEIGKGNVRFGLDFGYYYLSGDDTGLDTSRLLQFGMGMKFIID